MCIYHGQNMNFILFPLCVFMRQIHIFFNANFIPIDYSDLLMFYCMTCDNHNCVSTSVKVKFM